MARKLPKLDFNEKSVLLALGTFGERGISFADLAEDRGFNPQKVHFILTTLELVGLATSELRGQQRFHRITEEGQRVAVALLRQIRAEMRRLKGKKVSDG